VTASPGRQPAAGVAPPAGPGTTADAGGFTPAPALAGSNGASANGDGGVDAPGGWDGAGEAAAAPADSLVTTPGRTPGERGRPPGRLTRIRGELPLGWRIGLGAVGLVALFVVWMVAAAQTSGPGSGGVRVPYPSDTWNALVELKQEGLLWSDLWASAERILYGYTLSMAIGVVVGLGIGVLPGVEGTLEAPIGFLRYIPATALTPLLLLWLGLGEPPKITLIVVGTVFYNVLMVADVARSVPRELISAASTLGAGRVRTLMRVVLPYSVPGMIDVARINLAAGWLMLVVAELLATDEGLAVRIQRSTRFLNYDRMFAILILFGIIGMLSDLALRGLRWAVAAWDR
jgi:NitT/TauT family transport system permease protein